MFDWLMANTALLWSIGIASIVVFVATLIFVPIVLIAIPEDYFVHRARHPEFGSRAPLYRWGLFCAKNFLAVFLIAAGVVMLVLPGQGLLTILAGLLLLDFPGKFQFERAIVNRPSIARAINWIRAKANKPPIRLR